MNEIITDDVDKYCAFCGKKLERKYYSNGKLESVGQLMSRKYCDRECMKKAFLKLETDAGWYASHNSARNINRLIKNNNADTCEICGKIGKMDIHHIDENPQNNNPDNLQVLCRSCHMKIHRPRKICIVECCENIADGGLGYCNKHYLRFKKYGDPTIVRWDTRHSKNDADVNQEKSKNLNKK